MKILRRFTRNLLLESIPALCFWLLITFHLGLIGLLWAIWRMQ